METARYIADPVADPEPAAATARFVRWPDNVLYATVILSISVSRTVRAHTSLENDALWSWWTSPPFLLLGAALAARVLWCSVVVSPSGIQVRRLFRWVDVSWDGVRGARGIDRFPLGSLIQLTSAGDRLTTVRLGGWRRARRVDEAVARARAATPGDAPPFPQRWATRHKALAGSTIASAASLLFGLSILRGAQVNLRAVERGEPDRYRINVEGAHLQLQWGRAFVGLAVALGFAAAYLVVTRHRGRPAQGHAAGALRAEHQAPWPTPVGLYSPQDPVKSASIDASEMGWYAEWWGPAPDVDVTLLKTDAQGTLLHYRRGRFWFAHCDRAGVPVWATSEIRLSERLRLDPARPALLRAGPPRPVAYTQITFRTTDADHTLEVPVPLTGVRLALAFTDKVVVDEHAVSTSTAPGVPHV